MLKSKVIFKSENNFEISSSNILWIHDLIQSYFQKCHWSDLNIFRYNSFTKMCQCEILEEGIFYHYCLFQGEDAVVENLSDLDSDVNDEEEDIIMKEDIADSDDDDDEKKKEDDVKDEEKKEDKTVIKKKTEAGMIPI